MVDARGHGMRKLNCEIDLLTADAAVRLRGVDLPFLGFKLCPLCPIVVGAEVGLCHLVTGFLDLGMRKPPCLRAV